MDKTILLCFSCHEFQTSSFSSWTISNHSFWTQSLHSSQPNLRHVSWLFLSNRFFLAHRHIAYVIGQDKISGFSSDWVLGSGGKVHCMWINSAGNVNHSCPVRTTCPVRNHRGGTLPTLKQSRCLLFLLWNRMGKTGNTLFIDSHGCRT